MSLSLQVKKFINSEHTGEYVDIIWRGRSEEERYADDVDANGDSRPVEIDELFAYDEVSDGVEEAAPQEAAGEISCEKPAEAAAEDTAVEEAPKTEETDDKPETGEQTDGFIKPDVIDNPDDFGIIDNDDDDGDDDDDDDGERLFSWLRRKDKKGSFDADDEEESAEKQEKEENKKNQEKQEPQKEQKDEREHPSARQSAPRGERIRIHYMDEGNGEPLILIHTVGQSLYTWRKLYASLTERYRVIALDLPGHGYSSKPETFMYDIDDYAELIRLFMDALHIESAHMMAYSMGAAYALAFARENPERLGKLVLLSPGGITGEMPLSIRLMGSAVFGGIASALFGMRTVEKILGQCFFDLTNIDSTVVSENYRTASLPDARKAIRSSIQRFDEEALFAQLREIFVPALILWGSEDKWHTREDVELYHAALKNADLAVIRNAGHLLHEEKQDKVVDALEEYIPPVL